MKTFNDNIPPRAPGQTWLERIEHDAMRMLEKESKKMEEIFCKSFKRGLTIGTESFHIDKDGKLEDLLGDSNIKDVNDDN